MMNLDIDSVYLDLSFLPVSGYPTMCRIHNFLKLKFLYLGCHLSSFMIYTNTPFISECPKLKVILIGDDKYYTERGALLLLSDVSNQLIYCNVTHKGMKFNSLIHLFNTPANRKMKSLII